MGRDERQLRRMRGEALSRLLQGLTYGGCLVIFYALMAIPNWPLRNLSRTSATTLVTWVAMGAAMLAVFGRMTVRRGKHQQQAAGQCMGVLITDAVTYLQLQIMNVNPNNRTHLTLFGADFAYLLIAAALQMALVLLAMSFGARVLPKLQKPARLLLITEADADEIRQKLAKERTVFTIAHRLTTIKGADCIWVLTEKGVEEQGSHTELIAKGGLYAHLFAMYTSDR